MKFNEFDEPQKFIFNEEARAIVKLANKAYERRLQETGAQKNPISHSDIVDLKISLADPNSFFNKAGGKW